MAVQQLDDMSSIVLTNLRTSLNTLCLGPKDVSAEQRNSRQRVSQDESIWPLLNFDTEWRSVLSIWARPLSSCGRKHIYILTKLKDDLLMELYIPFQGKCPI